MRKYALILAVLLACPLAAAAEYDFYANTRYPGPTLREDVELYEVTTSGKGGPLAYERREVDWWPRKGVDLIPVKAGMPLRTWTLREGPIKAGKLADVKPVQETMTTLESTTNMGDHFVRRIVGYLYPPASGDFTFVFAARDQGSLFLSTDEKPENKKRIAWNTDWTKPRRWEFYPSQTSKAITLEKGKRYYIEVVHQEDAGEDHLGVGWKGPSIDKIEIVDGQFLSGLNGKRGSIVAERKTVPQIGLRKAWTTPQSFKAHLVGFRGMGNTMTSKWTGGDGGPREPGVVLRLPDGRKRFFATGSFGSEDKKYIMALYVKEMNRIKAGLVKANYVARVNPEFPNNAKPGEPGTMVIESKHFVWLSGSQAGAEGDPWVNARDPEKATWFREGSKECAEFFWALNEYAGHFMPAWGSTGKTLIKYQITVCGTKRDGYKVIPGYAGGGGGACGIKWAGGGPWAMSLFHEWGHGVQFGAQRMGGGEALSDTYQMFPDPSVRKKNHHILRPWRNVFNGGAGYTFCTFYNFMGEDPNWGYGHFAALPNGVDEWSYLMSIAREGQRRGLFKDGLAGMGDTVGEYGARLTTFDGELEDSYRRGYFAPARNWLETMDAKKGLYRIPLEESPEPFGINMTQLVADKHAKEIVIDFKGMHDPELYSDWRACLIAISADGSRRYSPMWSKGSMSLPIKADDVSHWLSVAATPTAFYVGKRTRNHRALNKSDLYSGRHAYRYPWSIQMTGATPGTPRECRADYDDADLIYNAANTVPAPHDTPAGQRLLKKLLALRANLDAQAAKPEPTSLQIITLPVLQARVQAEIDRMTKGARHPNGGGWVQSTATVAPTAYVGPNAMVLGTAKVLDNAIIDDFAVVTDQAVVSDHARICGQGLIKDQARANGYSRVWQTVEKENLATRMPKRPGAKDAHKLGLWANYAMDQADNAILEDVYRYAVSANKGYAADLTPVLNGYLFGRPEFVVDGEHRGFRFDGKTQYAELCPRAADLGKMTIDITFKPGRTGEQTIFDLGCSANNSLVLKLTKSLKPKLVAMVGGKKVLYLAVGKKLPVGQWSNLRVEIDGQKAAIFLDNQMVGKKSSASTTFRPSDVFPGGETKRNFLAATRGGKKPFAGVIDHVVIYHDVHENYAALPAPTHDAQVRPSASYLADLEKKSGNLAALNRKATTMSKEMLAPYMEMEKRSKARQKEIMERCPEYLKAVAALKAAEEALAKRKKALEAEFDKNPEIVPLKNKLRAAEAKERTLQDRVNAAERKAFEADAKLVALTKTYQAAEKKMHTIDQALRKEFDKRPDVLAKQAEIKTLRQQAHEMHTQLQPLINKAFKADAELQTTRTKVNKANAVYQEREKGLRAKFDARADATTLATKMEAANKRRHDNQRSAKEREQAGQEENALRQKSSRLWEDYKRNDDTLMAIQQARNPLYHFIHERERTIRNDLNKENEIAKALSTLTKKREKKERALRELFHRKVRQESPEYTAASIERDKIRTVADMYRNDLRRKLQTTLPSQRAYTQFRPTVQGLRSEYRSKRNAYVGKGVMALARKAGEAKGDVVAAEEIAWAEYAPERWLYSFNQQTYRGYYNTAYTHYIPTRARDLVGGGEMRENSNALETLAKAVAGDDDGWRTRVDWDWRIRPEIEGLVTENTRYKAWLERVRGPVLKAKPAPLK